MQEEMVTPDTHAGIGHFHQPSGHSKPGSMVKGCQRECQTEAAPTIVLSQ